MTSETSRRIEFCDVKQQKLTSPMVLISTTRISTVGGMLSGRGVQRVVWD